MDYWNFYAQGHSIQVEGDKLMYASTQELNFIVGGRFFKQD